MITVFNLLSNLTRLGVNITERQVQTLKWRLSDEGKKYYTDEETNEFYRAIEKGDTDIIDIVRKEKQKRINELKRKLGKK